MGEAEVRARIVATDSTGPAFESAKEGTDSLTEHMESGFERVAERLAEFFAIEKVVEFVKSSVTEYAKLERQFDILGVMVTNNGQKWDQWKGKVEDFLKSEESMYGFTKDQLMNALTDAETKVHDMGTALKITDEAEKLSILTHKSLQRSVDAISLAYEGNTSGLTQLGSKLGLTLAQSKDAKTVFDALAKATAGIGTAANDTQGQLNSMAAVWEDVKENVGETISPLIALFAGLERVVANLLQALFGLAGVIDDVLIMALRELSVPLKLAYGILESIGLLMTGNLREGIHVFAQTFKDSATEVVSAAKDMASGIGGDWKKMTGQMVATWEGSNKQVELMSDKTLAEMAIANQKHATEDEKATKKHLDTKLKIHEDYHKKLKKLDDTRLKENDALNKAIAADAGKLANTLVSLEHSKNKEVAEMARAVALGRAIMNTAVGISQALSDYPYPASLAVGALVAAEGAIEIAQISGVPLASGGVVMGPTHVYAGEGGEPEAVVPLSKLPQLVQSLPQQAATLGGGVTINVHGVQNAAQFVNQLPAHLQRAQTRLGNRLAAIS